MTQGFQTRKLSGFEIQWRVVNALVYRELRRRVGEVRGGFFAVLIEPVGAIAIWTAFLSAINVNRGGNLNVVLFLASGMVLFTTYSQISLRGLRTMEANHALFFYRRVKPIDTLIASALSESGLYASCLMLILPLVWFYLDGVVMSDFALFVVCFLLIATLGLSVAILYMVASHYVSNLRSVGPWVNRALWFLSGVPLMYLVLPQWTRVIFLWNPLLHCIEMSRHAMSNAYPVPEVNLHYPASCALLLLSFSLWVYATHERELIRR